MKVAPVSADLLIKVALVAAAAGAIWFVYRKAAANLPDLITAFDPTSDQNLAYKGTNAVLDAVISEDGPGRNADGSITAGGWAFDILNPGVNARIREMLKPSTSVGKPAPAPSAPMYDPTPGIY